jgi:hypothetical protein
VSRQSIGRRLHWRRAAAAGLVRGEQPFEPYQKPKRVPRFLVRAGTKCAISKVARLDWREHTTVKDIGFERFERYERTEAGGFYEFRHEGWLMLVHRRHVVHREDSYRSPAAPA